MHDQDFTEQSRTFQVIRLRNRMRVVKAIALIGEGKSVESIASAFGYSSPSAFIAMFKKLAGSTPASYRGGIGVNTRPSFPIDDLFKMARESIFAFEFLNNPRQVDHRSRQSV